MGKGGHSQEGHMGDFRGHYDILFLKLGVGCTNSLLLVFTAYINITRAHLEKLKNKKEATFHVVDT